MIFFRFTIIPTRVVRNRDERAEAVAAVVAREEDVRKCIPEVVGLFRQRGFKILKLDDAQRGRTPQDIRVDPRLEPLFREAAERGIACSLEGSFAT